jgi:hypothetical protein
VASLQVNEQRSITTAAAIRPIIDAKNARRFLLWQAGAAHDAYHRITATPNPEGVTDLGGGFAAERMSPCRKKRREPSGSPGIHTRQLRKAFSKHLALTGWIVTEEATDMQLQTQRFALQRKVLDVALIATLHSNGGLVTERATGFPSLVSLWRVMVTTESEVAM